MRYLRQLSGGMATFRRFTTRRLATAKDDSGQALVLALIIILMLAILVPVVGLDINSESVAVARAGTGEEALAAAEAGIQDYRNYLDNVAGYTVWNYGNTDGNAALHGWASVNGSSNEWFHYIPDASRLQAQTGGSQGQMLLEVTGRAGTSAANYAYRTVLAAYTVSGIVTDSYYSEYELTDPNEPGVYESASVTTSGTTTTMPLGQIQVEYAYTAQSGAVQYFGPESLLSALCVYHTYNENTFVDSLGSVVNKWVNGGASVASPTNPYYGPFYDNPAGGITFTVPATLPNGTIPPDAGATINIPKASSGGLCGNYGVGVYPSGVTFNGIAYSNDQLNLCGNPTFNGSPPLVSGAPSNLAYGDDWPGSVAKVNGGVTTYVPAGYTYDFSGGCSAGSQPTYGASASPKAPTLGGQQHLPTTTSFVKQYADGTVANGCVYTGPTMIEFVSGGTMNIWSPLTQNTEPNYSSGTAANCGTFSPSLPWQTGLPVPVNAPSSNQSGVIYVEGEQSSGANSGYATAPTINTAACSGTSTPPTAGQVGIYTCAANVSGNYVQVGQPLQAAVAASGTSPAIPAQSCINPYYTNYWAAGAVVTTPATSSVCEEGDAIVEGELSGQVTLVADNNVIVSRDLTYGCADGTGGANDANPSSVTACNQAGTNSSLGLLPDKQLVVAHELNQPFNEPVASPCSTGTTNTCNTNNAPLCTDDGTEATQTIANVVPWSCDVNTTFPDGTNGISIDAAVVSLNGSTYVPNFSVGSCLGNLDQQGTNINYFPGFNGSGSCQSGTSSGAGYNQVISYDRRLAYDSPPYLLAATDTVWNVTSFVVCGTINSGNVSTPAFQTITSGGQTYQPIYCPQIA